MEKLIHRQRQTWPCYKKLLVEGEKVEDIQGAPYLQKGISEREREEYSRGHCLIRALRITKGVFQVPRT